jgi:hypothetical protein
MAWAPARLIDALVRNRNTATLNPGGAIGRMQGESISRGGNPMSALARGARVAAALATSIAVFGSTVVAADDTTPPTATAPTWFLHSGVNLDGGKPKLYLQWSGSDDISGIEHFEIAQSTDGGEWVTFLTQQMPWNTIRPITLGHTYRFRVRAVDYALNVGDWVYGPTSRLSAIGDWVAAVRYRGSWPTGTSKTSFWGGSTHYSTAAGATASYTFTGRSIGWVGVRARTRGQARIYINGVYQETVELWSGTTMTQHLIWQKTYPTSATRTITIKVVGTTGRPRVDVDGFIVGS